MEPYIRGDPYLQLAKIYERKGQFKEAIVLHKQVVEMTRDAYGDTNPATLTAMNNLASNYSDIGQPEKTIRIYKEVIRGLSKSLGPESPRTLMTELSLGITYRNQSRPKEAIEVLEKVVPVLRKLANGSWLTSTAEFQLGRAYLDDEQFELAQKYLETGYRGYEQRLSQQPPSSRIGLANQIRTIIGQLEVLERDEVANKWRRRKSHLSKNLNEKESSD